MKPLGKNTIPENSGGNITSTDSSGDDSIFNYGENVTIDKPAGNGTITYSLKNVSINCGSSADDIVLAGASGKLSVAVGD